MLLPTETTHRMNAAPSPYDRTICVEWIKIREAASRIRVYSQSLATAFTRSLAVCVPREYKYKCAHSILCDSNNTNSFKTSTDSPLPHIKRQQYCNRNLPASRWVAYVEMKGVSNFRSLEFSVRFESSSFQCKGWTFKYRTFQFLEIFLIENILHIT